MKSFKVGVKTKDDTEWVYNGLRFGKQEDAAGYASDLMRRWYAVTEIVIEGSEDEPNATFPHPSDRYRASRGPPERGK